MANMKRFATRCMQSVMKMDPTLVGGTVLDKKFVGEIIGHVILIMVKV